MTKRELIRELRRRGHDEEADRLENSEVERGDDFDGLLGLVGLGVAAVELGSALSGLFGSSDSSGSDDFSGGGGEFGGGGAGGDY